MIVIFINISHALRQARRSRPAGQSGEGSKARGFAPRPPPGQAWTPPEGAALWTPAKGSGPRPPPGQALGTLHLAGVRVGCAAGRRGEARCFSPSSGERHRASPRRPAAHPTLTPAKRMDPKGSAFGGGSRGAKPPGGFQGKALTLLPSPDWTGKTSCRAAG